MTTLPLLLLAAAPLSAAPQDPAPLLLEGDLAPDGFAIQFLNEKLVGRGGSWCVGVNSLNPNTGLDDSVVVDGAPFIVPGDPVPGLPGETLDFFRDLDHARAGLTAWSGATVGTFIDFAALEDRIVAVEGDLVPAFLGLPAGTTYERVQLIQVVESGRVLLPCQLGIGGSSSWTAAAIVFETDAAHQVTGGHVAFLQYEDLSNGRPAEFVFFANNGTRMNDSGHVLWEGFDDLGTSVLAIDDQIVAAEDGPTPEPGLTWRSFAGPEVDLNDSGAWVARTKVNEGNDDVVMSSSGLVARQGFSHPAYPGLNAGDFGFNAPVFIANDGTVMFYVDLSGVPTSMDEAYVIGDEIVVREGVTEVGGDLIVEISDGSEGYRMSRDGRHLIFEADVDDGGVVREGVFLLTRGIGGTYCIAEVNSTGAAASISGAGSAVAAANDLTLTASQMPPNTFGIFVVSETQGNVPMAGGQGTLCLAGAIGRYQQSILSAGPAGTFSLSPDLTQVPAPSTTYAAAPGMTLNFQAWFRDANPTQTSNYTNGFSITFE